VLAGVGRLGIRETITRNTQSMTFLWIEVSRDILELKGKKGTKWRLRSLWIFR
jgi:hypothetical protein